MRYERDSAKAADNLAKHGVDFEVAVRVFAAPLRITVLSEKNGEHREVTIGFVGELAILAVVHTDRNGITRLISARPASRKEREKYHG